MARKKLSLGLQIDDRTDLIFDEALLCRSDGHRWRKKPYSEARLMETLRNGLIEQDRWCENGCGCEWLTILDAHSFTIVQNRRTYPDGYLITPGSGRLPRTEAKKAEFARKFPQFA